MENKLLTLVWGIIICQAMTTLIGRHLYALLWNFSLMFLAISLFYLNHIFEGKD